MDFPTVDCADCGGRGEYESTRRVSVNFDPERDKERLEGQFGASYDFSRDPNNLPDEWVGISVPEDIRTCDVCNGHGIISRRTGQAYKSRKMADRYRGTKAGRKCYVCGGAEKVKDIPVLEKCYDCNGTGQQLAWDDNADTVPEIVEIYRNPSEQFMSDWLAAVPIQVVRVNRRGTWGEYNIGRGLSSLTDYGKSWDKSDDDVRAEVVEHLTTSYGRPQMIKVVDKESRQLYKQIVVEVHRDGYVVHSLKPGSSDYHGLPPTYTDNVLDRPITAGPLG